MKEIQMTWDDWYAKYQPVMFDAFLDDGEPLEFDDCKHAADYVRENFPGIKEDDIAKHVWTCTSGDGWWYVSYLGIIYTKHVCMMVVWMIT